MKNKVLYISHSSFIGGAERSMMYMAMSNPESLLLTPKFAFKNCPIFELYKKNNINYETLTIPALFYHQYGKITIAKLIYFFLFLPNLFKLFKYIRKGYNILHFNEVVFAPTIWILKVFFGKRLKIVVHIRTRLPKNKFGLWRKLFIFWLKKSDYIITIGKKESEPFNDFQNQKMLINPISYEDYIPLFNKTNYLINSFKIANKKIIVGIFGSMHNAKGQSFVIDYLLNSSIDNRLVFIFFGEGPLLKTLKNKVIQNNLKTQIIFANQVNNVLECMEGCDFIIRAEIYGYFGRDILEANSLGVPILTSKCKENIYEHLLEEGVNGYSFIPLDYNSFTNKLNKILINFKEIRGNSVKLKKGFILSGEYYKELEKIYEQL
ncbi:MAG: glycosyltransferase [Candidatus Delongbacteria bacterium]|jgi:glycosyltransferase involved in cell wall biosynthesis|nr:glycosyltransferase [Candidatus Delongbacteria bacterium]